MYTLIANDDVWIEGEALRQLAAVAAWPGCVRAVGQPDLHPGPGVPIGAAFAFRDAVLPQLVGSDAGCGVRLVAVDKLRFRGDALERRVRDAFDGPPDLGADPESLFDAVWHRGVAGLADTPGVADDLAALAAAWATPEPNPPAASAPAPGPAPDGLATFVAALGTIGAGNHFAELSTVGRLADPDALGLRAGRHAVLVHSGSRGLGRALAERWGAARLAGPDAARYRAELAGAVRFAEANRAVLAWRLLDAVGAARPGRLGGTVDLIHNTVVAATVDGALVWVHRKGAAPADAGALTVVLGSRGAPSWVMRGAGSAAALSSVAHGAGRRMTRTEAVAKLKPRYRRSELARTALGGCVVCDDPAALYAEHPDAYKDIETVVASLEAAATATRVAALTPLVTVKR